LFFIHRNIDIPVCATKTTDRNVCITFKMKQKTIGIIGGMGPLGGIDVNKKIYLNTIADSDKNHLNIVHLSLSEGIPDRTSFLLGKCADNPAILLAEKIRDYPLDVVGVACNTFHSPKIFEVFETELKARMPSPQIVHLPNEVRKETERKFANMTIGVLCTMGTYQTKIYQNTFHNSSVHLKFPNENDRKAVHDAIYNIKQTGNLNPADKQAIEQAAARMSGVRAVMLACTELPWVAEWLEFPIPVIDANRTLARALIYAVAPEQLKP